MRGMHYGIAAGAAFGLILLNALYGHHLYSSPHQQSLDKYSIYVHLQPGWDSAPANILYDVTVSWGRDTVPENASYNANRLTEQNGRQVVSLLHGFSDCGSGWNPPLYKYWADALRSAVLYMQGKRLNADPYAPVFPDVPNAAYPDSVQSELVRSGYVQFVPVCTDGESSAFRYSVSVNDPGVGFDVHFVPSAPAHDGYAAGSSTYGFGEAGRCGALNRQSYTGYCDGMGPGSGLLVVLPDSLNMSITTVQVFVQEVTSIPGA